MSSENIQLSLSQLSLDPTTSHGEDWEHSPRGDSSIHQNSVAFPGEEGTGVGRDAPTSVASNPKRTLSELLKLHAEKGTEVVCSAEEASRLADVLGQWINSSSSPYEGEDEFFVPHAQDDSSLSLAKSWTNGAKSDAAGRPRGQSESVVRPAS